jgi:hypothetical protein
MPPQARKPTKAVKPDPWYQGYATAMASIHRGWHESSMVKMAMKGDSVTIEQLRDNGVDDYDLHEIERALGLRKD